MTTQILTAIGEKLLQPMTGRRALTFVMLDCYFAMTARPFPILERAQGGRLLCDSTQNESGCKYSNYWLRGVRPLSYRWCSGNDDRSVRGALD